MIPLSKLLIDKDELVEIEKVLQSGWLTKGPRNLELEKMVSEYLGVKHVVCTSSCTTALHLAVLGLNLIEGSEILVSDYTFPATGHAVRYCNLKPVFVDIDSKTYNMDPNNLRTKIIEKSKAIIVVHMFGQSAEMDEIMVIANEFNLPVIEDAACSLGSKYKDKFSGTIGRIGCFSMHATKGVSSGEGGLLVTNDDRIAEKVRSLVVFGQRSSWDRETSKEFRIETFDSIGFNYKMSDLAASFGIAQFKKLEKVIEKKNILAKYWNKKLKEVDYILPPYVNKWNKHNYQSYCCLVTPEVNRNKLIQILKSRGIQTQIGTYSSYIQPCYDNLSDNCLVSLDVYNRSIRLPMFYELRKIEIDYIVEVLKEVKQEVLIERR